MTDSRSGAGRGSPAEESWTDLPRAAIVDGTRANACWLHQHDGSVTPLPLPAIRTTL